MTMTKPVLRPENPQFSSGPCTKIPGWTTDLLKNALTGRSHRSSEGKARLKHAIDLTREVLGVPTDYHIAIVPASDTGAVEMALWSLLGERGVDMLAWESFGAGWINDVSKQLKLDDLRVIDAPYGSLPDLAAVDFNRDVVFTWNGTTSGVRVPDGQWIASDRQGLTICDATSAAFAQQLDFTKLDAVTYSWQKVLGGEGGHGMLILSPRAVARLENYTPPWPLPKIFRLTKNGKLNAGIFRGETINTPSMVAVEDYIMALEWGLNIGGLSGLMTRADDNAKALNDWVDASDWIENLAHDPATRSNTSVCLKLSAKAMAGLSGDEATALPKQIAKLLADEEVALDIASYRDAPPGLRIWCGATVETAHIKALTPWLDWAFASAVADLKSAA